MPKRTYYNDNVAKDFHSVVIVDVRSRGELSIKVFPDEKAFFKFLTNISEAKEENISAEHVWKYSSGGRLVEQNVIFKDRLHLMDVLTDLSKEEVQKMSDSNVIDRFHQL